MSHLSGLLLIGAAAWSGSVLHAQAPEARFTLTSCPRYLNVDKAAFNARYGDTRELADYERVLRTTFSADRGGYLLFTMRHGSGSAEFLTYDIPTARVRPAGLSSLASKGGPSTNVDSRRALRELLRDSVVIWDTLRIRVQLEDADFAHDGYALFWTDPADGTAYRGNVPNRGDTLLVHPGLFGNTALSHVQVVLRHRTKRQQDLATCTLVMLDEDQRAHLSELACGLLAHLPPDDTAGRARVLPGLCTIWHGRIPGDALPIPDCHRTHER